MVKRILFIILTITFISCDSGLSPGMASVNPGFGGTISFLGTWDKKVKRTHVVLFKNPLLSHKNFNALNLKFVSDSIATGTKTYKYSTKNINSLISSVSIGKFAYLAVAQSSTENLSLERKDWKIVGLYSVVINDSIKPKTLIIPSTSFIDSINITCDFNNPPPQPPGNNIENTIHEIISTFREQLN